MENKGIFIRLTVTPLEEYIRELRILQDEKMKRKFIVQIKIWTLRKYIG